MYLNLSNLPLICRILYRIPNPYHPHPQPNPTQPVLISGDSMVLSIGILCHQSHEVTIDL